MCDERVRGRERETRESKRENVCVKKRKESERGCLCSVRTPARECERGRTDRKWERV